MAYGDPNDFGWCNLVVKFLLFVTNIIVWVGLSDNCALDFCPSPCILRGGGKAKSKACTLFTTVACLPQLLGVALLGAGVYALTAPETNLENLDADNFLTAPAILLCIIGGLLFILGFCGCFGALLELYIPLIVVSVGWFPDLS